MADTSDVTPPETPAAVPSTVAPHSAHAISPLGWDTVAWSLLTAAFWGGTPVAVQYTKVLPPVMVAGLRFGLAALFMLAWCVGERAGLRIRTGQWKPILIASVMLFLQIVTFNIGVTSTNSSHSSLFINTFIFWVAAIEHFVTRVHRLDLPKTLGLLLAGTAMFAVLTLDSRPGAVKSGLDQPTLFGDLVLIVSSVILAIKLVYTRHAVRTTEPGKLIFWHDVFGTLMFLSWSGLFETTDWTRVNSAVMWGLVYQGLIVAGFCFALQAWQLKKHSASQIAVFSAATPLFGILFGAMFRGDPLSPWLLASSLCIAVGIWLVTRA